MTEEKKQLTKFKTRLALLKNERYLYEGVWKDIKDYQAPYRGQFEEDKEKRGQRKDGKMVTSAPALAGRVLSAGMNSSITSPSRPWFRLRLSDKELMERADIRRYLDDVEKWLYKVLGSSNFYDMSAVLYQEISMFGTAAMRVIEDFDNTVLFHTYTIGEYYVAVNAKNRIDVLYIVMNMTVPQVVEEFGIDNVSKSVKDMFLSSDNTTTCIEVIHAVEPNDERMPDMIDAKNKKYRSVYYESASNEDKFLRVSGFDEFPYVCPRWSTVGFGAYGVEQPGLVALGDSKQLMSEVTNKADGIQRNTKPPLQSPGSVNSSDIVNIPGGMTYTNDFSGSGKGIRSLYDDRVQLGDIREDIEGLKQDIRSASFVDLFLSILANDRPQDMKAEVAFQIDKERLLMLGPVLERLNNEWLDPVISRVIDIGQKRDDFPEAPEDIEGLDIDIEYVSALAKAQQSADISNMERLSGLVGLWAQADPAVIDKLDYDQGVDIAEGLLKPPAGFVRSDEEVDVVRQSREQSQQQQQMMESSLAAAGAAKDLSQAKVGEGSVLDSLVGV